MRIIVKGENVIEVSLSRKNIESLLYMLDNRDKARPALAREDDDCVLLVVAEENDEHYMLREPGTMCWERHNELH